MIKIDEIVIVEGKYDKIRLSNIIDATILTTEGFRIFKDKAMLELIKRLAKERGILILTDSDSAGFMIRNFLAGIIPAEFIKHAYIPDIMGKERRKSMPSKEGKLGVEGVPDSIIIEALDRAGVRTDKGESYREKGKAITKTDLFEDGLTGGKESRQRRLVLKRYLKLPEHLSTNALLQVLNVMMTREEYKKLVNELFGNFVRDKTK